MKVLTEKELDILSQIAIVLEGFNALPYHIDKEKAEFKKRIDELLQIVAIRAMLRDGDGLPTPNQTKIT